ncbi:NAD-dependent epimerase/dehydratase family protein [Francisella philomiragia]|uniref:NAD-dependent epimerase/dehydratase family protein n=1 Tax=Francisella philomiragia TaxID=28110 RepID=UPI001905F6BE|nr:NAD-dependent epimerase/dehydratase family protein [Francisella philomiragia]MBK2105433.1 NAD(P)-dependent oxidoreductase [Francisella philomiragia]
MVVGGGQLAQAFASYLDDDAVIIFASGVSNSGCIEQSQFDREKNLLEATLRNNIEKKIVYFSSCALSADDYPKNAYYIHKQRMEALIKKLSNKYYIFRIPQLFGSLKMHNTIINYIYNSIKNNHQLNIYSDAYRYVIEIEDVKKFVDSYLINGQLCSTVDVANPYRYRVIDIVRVFEDLMHKKAKINIVNKHDKYTIDCQQFCDYISKYDIKIPLGKDYLRSRLISRIKS